MKMKQTFCPKCNSPRIKEIGNGYYKCINCGYTGTLAGQGIIKK